MIHGVCTQSTLSVCKQSLQSVAGSFQRPSLWEPAVRCDLLWDVLLGALHPQRKRTQLPLTAGRRRQWRAWGSGRFAQMVQLVPCEDGKCF